MKNSFSPHIRIARIAVMTTLQLDTAHKAKPFRPFNIHTGDGRVFHVAHPEFLARAPSGRTVVVYQSDDSFSILDLLLMTELEMLPPSKNPGEAA